jgi:hypothetical protein
VLARALWLTPAIAGLHSAGAVRHVGALGVRLDELHQISKRCGTLELILCAAYVVTHFMGLNQAKRSSP